MISSVEKISEIIGIIRKIEEKRDDLAYGLNEKTVEIYIPIKGNIYK